MSHSLDCHRVHSVRTLSGSATHIREEQLDQREQTGEPCAKASETGGSFGPRYSSLNSMVPALSPKRYQEKQMGDPTFSLIADKGWKH